jgi:hypothetical protein
MALEEPKAPEQVEEPQPTIAKQLFVTRKARSAQSPQQNKIILIAGGAVAVALLLFVFSSAPTQKHTVNKGRLDILSKAVQKKQAVDDSDEQKSLFPIVESTPPRPAAGMSNDQIGEQDLEHMAKRAPQPKIRSYGQPTAPQAGSLGAIPPFDQATPWQAPPYQPTNASEPAGNNVPKIDHEHLPSLVFVRKVVPSSPSESTKTSTVDDTEALGLPVGTRLRARLESAASTAVSTPVIAVIEYNYESNGEIVVPAGSKVFGRIEQADRSGYLSIKFNSLLMPDAASVPVEAVATDLNLGPLRGKVQGKNSGKNALVRSLSGMGEVASLVVGRSGSINQAFSEGDLIRERVSTNIGESADQEVMRLSMTQHIVVSVPANTPIYVVLEKTTKPLPEAQSPRTASLNSTRSSESADSLRQLLQLQRELNQSSEDNPK